VRVSRQLHLEASIWVDRAFDNFPPILGDPRGVALWDKSVDHVDVDTEGPLRVGSTFDAIGPARGRRPGQLTSYRVAYLDRMTNTVEILQHPFFTHGVWSMHFAPNGERTKVDCAVDLTAVFSANSSLA
jgi:hypothetical protein